MQALVPLVKWHSVGPLFYLARRIRVSALSWILFLLWNGNRVPLGDNHIASLARVQSCGAQCGYPSTPLLHYSILHYSVAPVPHSPARHQVVGVHAMMISALTWLRAWSRSAGGGTSVTKMSMASSGAICANAPTPNLAASARTI